MDEVGATVTRCTRSAELGEEELTRRTDTRPCSLSCVRDDRDLELTELRDDREREEAELREEEEEEEGEADAARPGEAAGSRLRAVRDDDPEPRLLRELRERDEEPRVTTAPPGTGPSLSV